MSSGPYDHGILGQWAVVCFGFNTASIISSVLVIAVVVYKCFKQPLLFKQTTFRISASIAACNIIYSSCQMCTYYNDYMSSLPEINLRVIYWMMSGSTVTFALLTGCIGIQLILTVVYSKRYVHERIEPWYECASFFIGFLVTHPILYIYKKLQWASRAQVFHVFDSIRYFQITAWLTKWVWVFIVCTFLIITTVLVFWRMIHIFDQPKRVSNSSQSSYPCISKGYEDNHRANKRKTWLVTFQSLLYVFVPICTQSWILVANMIVDYPMWLYVMASIIPATQGMLNLLVFLNNPVLDRHRREITGKWIKSFYRKRQQSSSTISNTAGSTIASSISISFDDSSHFDNSSMAKQTIC